MDPEFPNFVMTELKELIADMENALQPANVVLHEVVIAELRRQHDKRTR